MGIWVVSILKLLCLKSYKHLCISLCMTIYFQFSRINTRSKSARSYGTCIFSFIRNNQPVFQTVFILHSYLQCRRIPVVPYPHQHLVVSILTFILLDIQWDPSMVLLCISLMIMLKKRNCHCFPLFPFYLPWNDGTRCHDLSFF